MAAPALELRFYCPVRRLGLQSARQYQPGVLRQQRMSKVRGGPLSNSGLLPIIEPTSRIKRREQEFTALSLFTNHRRNPVALSGTFNYLFHGGLGMRVSVLLFIIISLLTFAVSSYAGDSWILDFETDDGLWQYPPDKDMGGVRASVIDSNEGALTERKSLLGDSMGLDTMWHEFLHTTEKVKLKSNARYTVRMQAYVGDIDLGERGKRPAFYFMLRSRSKGPNDATDVYGPFWLYGKDYRTEVGYVLHTKPEINDYYLLVGILGRGKLVVDNITITEIDGKSPAYGMPIKPMPEDNHPAWDVLKAHREKYNLPQILEDMTVVGIMEMCNGTYNEVLEFMDKHVKPDAIDWAWIRHTNLRDLAIRQGIWFPTSAIEYQEHYSFEEPDIWPRRWELLGDSGFTRTLAGQINYWETFGEGGYYTCHNGPFWSEYYKKVTVPLVDVSQGICQDNIGVPPFTSAKGCFCTHCEKLFREHLKSLYTESELSKMGIDNLDSFSFKKYALDYGLTGVDALEDALVREYIRFQHITHRDRWLDYCQAFKERADEKGHPISTSGNQIDITQAFKMALSAANDIVEVERLEYFPDYRPNNISVAYKTARASGYNQRPVWFRGTNHVGPEHDLNTSWACQEMQYGEAAANGGLRTIHMADDHWPALTVTKAYTRIPEMREMTEGWANLLRNNRAIYSNRESMARVGLVYSMPTTMWNYFEALKIENHDPRNVFEQTSHELDRYHIPHDVLILGYQGLWDDNWSFEQMKRYKVLIVPDAQCISGKQLAAFREFVSNGGILYVGSKFAQLDENYNPRSEESYKDLALVTGKFGVRPSMFRELAKKFGMRTNAPETMTINPWLSADGHAVTLHIVNYNLDAKTNEVTSPGRVTAEIDLPAGRTTPFNKAFILTVDGSQQTPQVIYDFSKGKATVIFTLDRPYGAVVLADGNQLLAKEKEISIRRARVQAEVREYNMKHLTYPPPQ